MAGEKHVDLPDEFEALLRREMTVAPSPEFLPRVRERISEAPQRFDWRPWFVGVAGAVASVTVAVIATMPRSALSPPAPPRAPVVSVASPIVRPDPAEVTLQVMAARQSVPPIVRRTAMTTPLQHSSVVIDTRQRAALTTVLQMVSDGRLNGESFKNTAPPSMQPIRDRIVPIGVKPLEVSATRAGGVLQPEK